MTLIYLYLGIGVLYSCYFSYSKRIKTKQLSKENGQNNQESRTLKVDERFWIDVFAFVLCFFVWPLVIYFQREETSIEPYVQETFDLKKEDLIESYSIEAIEQKETVFDPLNAAPPISFGHFHGAWLEFKKGIEPDVQLWSFRNEYCLYAGTKQVTKGYLVLTEEGLIAQYFTAESFDEAI